MSSPDTVPNPPESAPEPRKGLSTRQWLLILNFCVTLAVLGQYVGGVTGRTLVLSAVGSYLSLNVTFLIARKYGKEEGPGPGQYPLWAMVAIAVGLLLISIPTREGRWQRAVQSAQKALVQRNLPEAEKELNRALQIAQKLGPTDKHVITTLNDLLVIYELQGKAAQLEATLRNIAALQQRSQDPDEAATLGKLGVLYLGRNQPDKAEQTLKRALEIREKTAGPQSAEYARALTNLAVVYRATGKAGEAEALYLRAVEILEKDVKTAPELTRTLVAFGELRGQQRRFDDARALFQRALDLQMKTAGKETVESAAILKLMGEIALAQGRTNDAELLLRRALGLQQAAYAARSANAAVICLELGWIREQRKDYGSAEPLFRHAVQATAASHGLYHPETARALAALAMNYWKQGKLIMAEQPLSTALRVYEKVLGPQHPMTKAFAKNYEEFLKQCPGCRREKQKAPPDKEP